MSVIPIRPPGRRTRAISRKTDGLSAARFTTQLLITTSTESEGSGMASMVPLRNSTFVAPDSAALRWARASISSVMSRPMARPCGPTRFAERRTSIPPPEPRSRTRSPGCRSATASGLPQPSEAMTAASGSSARSRAEYRSGPMPGSSQQAAAPVLWTLRAACAYRSRTCSWIWLVMGLVLLRAVVLLSRAGRARTGSSRSPSSDGRSPARGRSRCRCRVAPW